MQKARVTLCAAIAAALLLSTSVAAPAAAAQSIPEILGTYLVSGTYSFDDCQLGEPFTVPITIYLIIDQQDGSRFSGYLGYPDQQVVVFTLSGTVGADGAISGTWVYVDEPDNVYHDEAFTGRIADGKADIALTALAGDFETFTCHIDIVLSTETGLLQWSPPDLESGEALPPPRALTFADLPESGEVVVRTDFSPRALLGERPVVEKQTNVTGYNVYRSKTPGVETTPGNLFASVPATTTTVPAPVGDGGSFFVVTATYPEGESNPSNEVSGGVEAATLGPVKVTAAKIVAKGTGFSKPIQVLVDGIPFLAPAKVKPNFTKVTQKGALLTGQALFEYITPGKTVAITFRNANGGIATYVYTRP
jgi:hypothetical protein